MARINSPMYYLCYFSGKALNVVLFLLEVVL
jgi:hypothetical protein